MIIYLVSELISAIINSDIGAYLACAGIGVRCVR